MSEIGYFVAKIRHEFTRYDKLCSFYSVYPYARKKLNRTIGKLIGEKITIDEFHKIVRGIEAEVDLTRKDNQRRYLKQRSRLYRENGWPDMSWTGRILLADCAAVHVQQNILAESKSTGRR